jgi:hypothetical protein
MKASMIALACALMWGLFPEVYAAPSPEPPADVTCKLDSGAASFSAVGGPKGTTVDVARAGYQGNATFTFKSATPARVLFRFGGVRQMQTLTVSDGKHSFSCPGFWTGTRTVSYFDKSGRAVNNSALAAVTMVMEPNKSGDLEVSLSSARDMELGAELKVNWVQYLRVKRGNFAPVMIGD